MIEMTFDLKSDKLDLYKIQTTSMWRAKSLSDGTIEFQTKLGTTVYPTLIATACENSIANVTAEPKSEIKVETNTNIEANNLKYTDEVTTDEIDKVEVVLKIEQPTEEKIDTPEEDVDAPVDESIDNPETGVFDYIVFMPFILLGVYFVYNYAKKKNLIRKI